MDTEISLMMANLAQARRGSLIMDPFVGTGSILVACAWFGAQTLGGDIDMRVLRGWIGTSNRSQAPSFPWPQGPWRPHSNPDSRSVCGKMCPAPIKLPQGGWIRLEGRANLGAGRARGGGKSGVRPNVAISEPGYA